MKPDPRDWTWGRSNDHKFTINAHSSLPQSARESTRLPYPPTLSIAHILDIIVLMNVCDP
eukprot:1336612-Amorphochlora_amoeboformis.AAC.1